MNQNNQDKPLPFDCQGTCKTPIGCTCSKANKKATAIENEGGPIVYPSFRPAPAKTCGCKSKKGGCCSGKNKLEVYNWLEDLPESPEGPQMVEVQFKNTRKGYYLNSNNIEIYRGDIVAVEATPGHDIGEVTLTGKLVQLQMLKNNYRGETKRIYRIAKPNDIEKWEEAKSREHKTMLRAREIAEELNLNMKISDVEFQGDGNKAIFYYIADERVDFRQLIKVYASEFHVKIEMKQIGARQEAGRVGGIGPCGRELCCSSSMSNFVSVSTSAARLQDIPLNPQKLAGQCGKLKCCLNFEVDTYVEAQRKLPSRDIVLETRDSSYYHFKTDILSGMISYSTDKNFAANIVTIPKDRVYEIIRINKQGKKPEHLADDRQSQEEKPVSYDILQENINRFDDSGNNSNNARRNKKKKLSKNKQQGEKQESSPIANNENNRNKGQERDNRRGNNNKQQPNRNQTRPTAPVKPTQAQGEREQQPQQADTNSPKRNNNFRNNRNKNRNRSNKNDKPDQKNPEA